MKSIALILMLFPIMLVAQQPFEEYGYKPKIATLSGGKYNEFFDQDSLVEIGSVVLSVNTGKIVYFVLYDTTYSEATLQPEVISRWLSPDPLASERYDYSPYNFVRNNPIIFNDPTGMLDQYYGIVNGNLTYLGDDGQGNDMRLVAEGFDQEAKANLNGANTTDEQRAAARNSDMSTVITFDETAIQGQFQGASDRTQGGNENSVLITFDPATAVVSAEPGAQGTNTNVTNTFTQYEGGTSNWSNNKVVVGVGHGHPVLQSSTHVNGPGYSADDSREASKPNASATASYAIDSYLVGTGGAATIHEVKPGGKAGLNPVGTTQNTNGIGKRAFLSAIRP